MSAETIPVRHSHLLRHCAVGAIVRGEHYLVCVQDTRYWYPNGQTPAPLQYVEQVRQVLGISQELRPPPTARITDEEEVEGHWIPAVLFPTWIYCPNPKCGLLHRIPSWNPQAHTQWRCQACANGKQSRELEQVPWVMAHEEGYMADVPWHFIAHAARNPNADSCRPDWNTPYLHLLNQEGQIRVQCSRCQAREVLSDQRPRFPAQTWQQPWLREAPPGQPEERAWLLRINDVRVHESWTSTALVIPPESRIRKGTVLDRLHSNTHWQRELKNARTGLQRRQALRRVARHCRCSVAELENAMQELDNGYPLYGQTTVGGELLQSEYHALIHPLPDLSEDEDFVTAHHTQAWKTLQEGLTDTPRHAVEAIDRLIEVRRLKEIMVLRGFRRLNAEKTVPPDITGQTGWLPALELHGEGIFFTLDEAVVQPWEQQQILENRADVLRQRAAPVHSVADKTEISPRFLLLHTLAHLLIRHFETEAGYPAASLKERIYCARGKKPMSGILIYVAVPDEVGSLGGLGELAAPARFLRAVVAAFDTATWCSLDPVCAEHTGQGPNLLNRAACHACVLIPEPSCLYGNEMLDRAFVKRDDRVGIRAVLDYTGENG